MLEIKNLSRSFRIGSMLWGKKIMAVDDSVCCKFAPRCRYARDICRERPPCRVDLGDGHSVACFKLNGYAPAPEDEPALSAVT